MKVVEWQDVLAPGSVFIQDASPFQTNLDVRIPEVYCGISDTPAL